MITIMGSMNVFRLGGDLSHILAIFILLIQILRTKSCAGISGKSQILYLMVFTTRYLDLITIFISLYNTALKVLFICTSLTTVILIFITYRRTYEREYDSFRIEFLVILSAILAILINHDFTFVEVLWTFSIYLEAVAILPQLFLISETGEAETITSHYLFALGCYRVLYLFNWIWRYNVEGHYDLIAVGAGVIQTLLYSQFFYMYFTRVLRGKKLRLSENSTKEENRSLDKLRHNVYREFQLSEEKSGSATDFSDNPPPYAQLIS